MIFPYRVGAVVLDLCTKCGKSVQGSSPQQGLEFSLGKWLVLTGRTEHLMELK